MARGHLDELQKAEIVGKSQLIHSVFIKAQLNNSQVIHFIIEVVATDSFHCIYFLSIDTPFEPQTWVF